MKGKKRKTNCRIFGILAHIQISIQLSMYIRSHTWRNTVTQTEIYTDVSREWQKNYAAWWAFHPCHFEVLYHCLNCNNITIFWHTPHKHNRILSALKKEFIQNYTFFTQAKITEMRFYRHLLSVLFPEEKASWFKTVIGFTYK